VGTSAAAKRGQFWRKDWFVAVLIVLAVLVLNSSTDAIETLEQRSPAVGTYRHHRH
jgi:hypothetical protein